MAKIDISDGEKPATDAGGASPANPLRPCDPTRTQVNGGGHGVRERGASPEVERHLRWLVRGTGRHGAERPFNESDLHLYRGEQREHVSLREVADWGRRHVRQCIPLW